MAEARDLWCNRYVAQLTRVPLHVQGIWGSGDLVDDGSIVIACEATDSIGLAYHQNRVPVVREIAVENRGQIALDDIRLTVSSEPGAVRPFELRIDNVAPGAKARIEAPDITLDPAALKGFTEAVALELIVEVVGTSGVLKRHAVGLRLLPPSHWGGGRSAPELVAAFVRPNDPAVDVVLHDASAKLAAAGLVSGLDGYGEGGRGRAWDVAAAIWAALADRRIAYTLPPASFEVSGQKVRSPGDVLERGVGTCLDLTLLYVASLEQAGLEPLVVLVHGHAFAGVWLTKGATTEATADDMQVLRKRRDLQELVLVETTLLTSSPPADFAAAVARGAAAVEEGAPALDVAIDVRSCRALGIRPMDLGDAAGAIAPTAIDAAPQSLSGAPVFRDEVVAIDTEEDDADRIERWKRRLLDLTLRNKLLNFRAGPAVVTLDCPDPAALEDLLAAGRALRLVGEPDEVEGDAPRRPQNDGREGRFAEALARGEVHVAMGEKALGDRLLNLFRLSRNAFEEGGANILYLAIGFLRWTRKGEDDAHRAPLLLLPVALRRSSARAGFRLSLHDDDARINPTLLELLRQDFALRVPALEGDLPRDTSGLDVPRIFDLMRAVVRDRRGWEVETGVALTTLSFSTYLMWRDLVERADALKRNALVRHLIDTPKHAFGDGSPFPEPSRLDCDWPPQEVFAPLPADSSQLSAVLAAAQGRDFVLFGPPGTGKSQTICNIVSQCLAGGKTVLFVSQKTAALEVVQRRLESIGLGPHCLEVHSAKAQKSAVLARLGEAWHHRARVEAPGWEETAAELASSRNALNALVEAVHRRRGNGMTAFQGFSAVVASPAPPFTFAWSGAVEHAPVDLAALRRLCRDLRPVLDAVGSPAGHPLSGMDAFAWSPRWRRKTEAALDAFALALSDLTRHARRVAEDLDLALLLTTRAGVGDLAALAEALLDLRATEGSALLRDDANELLAKVGARDRHRAETARLMARCTGLYRDSVLDQDLDAMLEAWLAAAGSNFLVRGGRKRQVANRLAVHANGAQPDDLGPDLAALLEAKRHVAKGCPEAAALDVLGPPWSDPSRDAAAFAPVAAWAEAAAGALEAAARRDDWQGSARAHLARILADRPRRFRPGGEAAEACGTLIAAWAGAERASEALCTLAGLPDTSRLPSGEGWAADGLALAERWRGGLAGAQAWSAWREVAAKAEAAGLDPLVRAVECGDVAAHAVGQTFEAAYARWWVDALVGSDETLRRFVPERHEDAIERFRALDAEVAELSKRAVLSRLGGAVPGPNAFATDPEWGLLSRELAKKRAHLPLRKLFAGMPRALTALTPCLMMSPLSIAQYLPPDAPLFDVVVFDEASQIAPWYAVGAMARGRQLVIVGDPEQLPPTSVGDRGADEVADGTDVADQESILDECLAANVPRRNLDWHYRSRHESLIAFSNERYYAGRLVTFPSPLTRDRAVRLVHVADGLYERGAGRVNRPEARAVADWVVARLLDPAFADAASSLGIVTFNGEQQRLVENLLDERRRSQPELERFFDKERWREPVFVKNLENVQGDERDVIVFSVAVGRDAAGRVSSTVSSLNKQGGHRRLNVAVTRARAELVVFASLKAADIDLGRSGARGVRDFKHFLDYAEHGPRALAQAAAPTGADHDSPFEAAVMAGLEARGWTVHPQVGVSGFRVDLGVVHPDEPGRYLAGVECDGATYHRSATARDRDRLREMVLTDLGWRIRRVWSLEWWADAAAALDKVHARLACDLADDRDAAARGPAPGEANVAHVRPEAIDLGPMMAEERPDEPAMAAAVPAEQVFERYSSTVGAHELSREPSSLSAREPVYADRVVAPVPVNSDVNAEAYRPADLAGCGFELEPGRFYEPSYRCAIEAAVAHVVACEAPLFEDLLVRRVARAHGIGRAGRSVRETILSAVDPRCARSDEDEQRVIWPPGESPVPARPFRGVDAATRNHAEVPLAELAGLATRIRASQAGADPIKAMAAELNLSRIEAATRGRLERALAVADGPSTRP